MLRRRAVDTSLPTSRLIIILSLFISVAASALAENEHSKRSEKVLYIWAQDQAQVAPDFLAVIDFDEQSPKYGRVINVVPVPPPGNTGNEPHHCHLNSNKTILGCGGLLSLLKGQNGIFFFDVRDAKKPRFLFSTKAVESAMTDDFLPLDNGGFLITQMGSATGMAPGRVAEFDGRLHFVKDHFGTVSLFNEWPSTPPLDGFNPHGISARPDLNLMMTSDFILPSSTLMGSMGPVLRSSVRLWNFRERLITKTIDLVAPDGSPALGTMDVKMPQITYRVSVGTCLTAVGRRFIAVNAYGPDKGSAGVAALVATARRVMETIRPSS